MIKPQADAPAAGFRPFFNRATGEWITYTAIAEDNHGQLVRFTWRSVPGGVITEHIHPRQEERFTILAGQAHFTLNGQEHLAGAGETVVVPAGVPHSEGNAGPDEIDGIVELRPALHARQLARPEEAVMTAPHAVLKKFPPLGKPKSPGLAAVEIRDLSKHFGPATTVRAQDPVRLTGALERRGHRVDCDGDVLNVLGATPEEVGEIAGHEQLAVLGLAPRRRSLEEAFIALTGVQS